MVRHLNSSIAPGARCESLETRQLLSAGQRDESFRDAALNFGAQFFALQNDKTILLNLAYAPPKVGSAQFQPFLFVTRLNADGSLDTTFGMNDPFRAASTRLSAALPDGSAADYFNPVGLAVTPAGLIDVLASTSAGISLAQLTVDGHLNNSFGNDGQIALPIGATKMVMQSNGGMVLAGAVDSKNFTLARVTSAGLLDPTFGKSGIDTFVYGAGKQGIEQLALRPDDSILAAGRTGNHHSLVVLKLNSDGTPDAAFGDHGFVSIANPNFLNSFAAAPDGGAFIGFGRNLEKTFDVLKLTGAGVPDSNFGPDDSGRVAITLPMPDGSLDPLFQSSILVDHAGRLLIGGAGENQPLSGPVLLRLLPDGSLDPSFGKSGRQMLRAHYGFFPVSQLAETPNGEIQASIGGYEVDRYFTGPSRPAPISLSHGTLLLFGTSHADTISASLSGSKITARVNSITQSFKVSDIKGIIAYGIGGGD